MERPDGRDGHARLRVVVERLADGDAGRERGGDEEEEEQEADHDR